MQKDFYPARYFASDALHPHWADSPSLAKAIWMRLREEDPEIKEITWYGLDLTILDPTSIIIHVREMADNFHGGIGREVYSTEVNRFTLSEQKLLEELIERRKMLYAEDEFNRREAATRLAAIKAVRNELFGTD